MIFGRQIVEVAIRKFVIFAVFYLEPGQPISEVKSCNSSNSLNFVLSDKLEEVR